MARANVKINTAKVVGLLREKSNELRKQLAEIPALEKKHKADVEAWKKKVIASIGKTTKPNEVSVTPQGYGEYRNHIKVELTYYLPEGKLAERPDSRVPGEYSLKSRLSEIEQTLKLLELTDDETVSASVYRNLADLL